MGRGFAGGIVRLGVALVLTIYFLIDGRRTYRWVAAFVPTQLQPKLDETAKGASRVIAAYVRGNLITSTLCAITTWITLAALSVPAAFLLALLAGILDLVPVIGFFLSAAPAVLLGFTVSATVGVIVIVFCLLYNLVENDYIQPKVYGRELRLSDLAVIAAFLVVADWAACSARSSSCPLRQRILSSSESGECRAKTSPRHTSASRHHSNNDLIAIDFAKRPPMRCPGVST